MKTRGISKQSLMNCQMNGAVDICLLCIPPSFRTVLDSGFGIIISLQFWGGINQGAVHFFSQGVILGTRACPLACLPGCDSRIEIADEVVDPFG